MQYDGNLFNDLNWDNFNFSMWENILVGNYLALNVVNST